MMYGNYYSSPFAPMIGADIMGQVLNLILWVFLIVLILSLIKRFSSDDSEKKKRDKNYHETIVHHDYPPETTIHRDYPGTTDTTGSTALDILKERYARGEITKLEYEDKKRELGL